MNEPTTSREDELVAAVLDDEATETERAAVHGDERLRARLAEFAAIRARVAAVEPVSDAARDEMLRRVIEGFRPDDAAASHQEPTDLAVARAQRHRRIVRVAGVAAALLVVVPLLAITLLQGGTESNDSASSSAADSLADAPTLDDVAGSASAPTATELGVITSEAGLRTAVRAALASAVEAERAEGGADSNAQRRSGGVFNLDVAAATCATTLTANDPSLGSPVLVATATWAGEAAFVIAFGTAATPPPTAEGPRSTAELIVVTRPDCTPVERVDADR